MGTRLFNGSSGLSLAVVQDEQVQALEYALLLLNHRRNRTRGKCLKLKFRLASASKT